MRTRLNRERKSDINRDDIHIEYKGSSGFSKIGYINNDVKYGLWISGRYYADEGMVINNPIYVIEYLLRSLGYNDTDSDILIDTISFDLAASEFISGETETHFIKGVILERESLYETINGIMKEYGLAAVFGGNRKNYFKIFKLIPSDTTSVFTFTDDEIIREGGIPSFRMMSTRKDQIYNAFNFSYGNNYVLNKYLYNVYIQDLNGDGTVEYSTNAYTSIHGNNIAQFCQASQDAYGGEKLLNLDFDYVYDTTTMENIMVDFANYNCYQKWLIELDCIHTVDTAALEIGDIVRIDTEGLSTYIKGTRPFRIIEKTLNGIFRERTYRFTLLEIPNSKTGLGGIINISDKDWVA